VIDGTLEGALRIGGLLIAAGLIVQLASFFWNHPLAFIAFAAIGGGLTVVGALVYISAAVRAKAWQDPVGTTHSRSTR
jgi:uncharacterized membrane protein